jgi:dephospho-CoA kinase
MKLVIGLTGGIGSGKSTVAEMFAKLGGNIIDTDVIAHQLTAAGQPALTTIAKLFGKGIMTTDGTLDRIKLRDLVFNNAIARKKLEEFLHPLIREQVSTALTRSNSSPYSMVVVPLLFETKAYQHIIQRSLVIDCPEQLQLQRALTRVTMNEPTIRAVMAAQFPRQQRLAKADDVIVNDGGYEKLKEKVEEMHEKYLSLA